MGIGDQIDEIFEAGKICGKQNKAGGGKENWEFWEEFVVVSSGCEYANGQTFP